MKPPDHLLERVERLLGSRPVGWERGKGGYTTNERWSLMLDDGRSVFAKMAPSELMAGFLRLEHANMSLFEADFRCEILAWEDDPDEPLLVLEDLRDARWPPPWEPGDVERVVATLERMWSLPSDQLPLGERFAAMFSGWSVVAEDPSGFLSLGLASREWLDACLPALIDAERAPTYEGDDFIHMDVRSDNMCIADGRVVLVDWNWAVRGPRELDLACWLCALRLEGGPLPEEVGPHTASYAAGIAGYFAKNAHLPAPPTAPTVRRFQLRQLRIALPWACRVLGLPMTDVPYARIEIAALDEDLAAGRIDDTAWHNAVEEVLIDAYLASDDPRAQSGKGGDESEWRWARELVLDAFPRKGTFLDVGCANGYLMESVHRWARERGMEIEPYGLDISWRIAALAKQRLPHWADRIFVGNVIDWEPPMKFDVVQSGLDEGTPRRQRELVDRIQRELLVPGGVHVFRANRVVGDEPGQSGSEPDRVEQLRAIGLEPDGVIEAVHPDTGAVRRTAWLRAR
jgi:hypothetical protein